MRGQKRRGRQITAEALEEKISKAQDKLAITKKAYDEAAQELRNLFWINGMRYARMNYIISLSAVGGPMNR